ncbi:ferritin-like domain-containing protein [uncultured Tateyamaria sp.]|uniref:ferritin-like domain-containing protein n=1 Tax=uncultured Tateyamaria sp. TaxID=455651 RepID=UPI0026318167|nr:ferritin-like domain-containing protein [uncultured Tateyamaria sp.]
MKDITQAWQDARAAKDQLDLSASETFMVFVINLTMSRDQVKTRLAGDLQAAVSVELATIPIYLYTYYSINRTQTNGQDLKPSSKFANNAGGAIMSVAVEEMLHMSLSSNIYFALTGKPPTLYMNAPGYYPTMLPHHNPVGPPGPGGPTDVDTHIPLRGFSFEQMWHFLQIEYPMKPVGVEIADVDTLLGTFDKRISDLSEDTIDGDDYGAFLKEFGWPSDENWNSIGQFYSYIRCLIASSLITDDDFTNGARACQIQAFNYAPNNVDTMYPTEKFSRAKPAPKPTDPKDKPAPGTLPNAAYVAGYMNEPDSHSGDHSKDWEEDEELISVSSKQDAFTALATICEQGEGYGLPEAATTEPTGKSTGSQHDKDGEWRNYTPEDSHFWKFLRLQSRFSAFEDSVEQLPMMAGALPWMKDEIDKLKTQAATQEQYDASGLVSGGVVYDYPNSPVSAQYPQPYSEINDFLSGLFQYMLILSETIYLVPSNGAEETGGVDPQHLFFNQALHRSMIWVMDKYIQYMRELPPLPSGPHAGKTCAPTFENLSLGTREQAFDALKVLGDKAIAAAHVLDPSSTRVKELVDRSVDQLSPDGKHSMNLPNTADYWVGNLPQTHA